VSLMVANRFHAGVVAGSLLPYRVNAAVLWPLERGSVSLDGILKLFTLIFLHPTRRGLGGASYYFLTVG